MKLKIYHITFILSLFLVVATALAGYYIFSKENIIIGIEKAIYLVNQDSVSLVHLCPTNELFIAKIIRRFDWSIHFLSGIVLSISFFFFILYRAKTTFIKVSFILLFFTFLTGLLLYFRFNGYLTNTTFEYLKLIHKIFAFSFGLFIFVHIISKIKKGDKE